MGSFDQITNFVVLMMENRAFDHMVGFMKAPDYQIEGLDGTETIPADPTNPASQTVQVNNNAAYRGDFNLNPGDDKNNSFVDPNHDVPSVHEQLFAGSPNDETPTNKGFVANYLKQQDGHKHPNTPDHAKSIVNCFSPDKLPVLTTLAREFALCDHWHASVPGPTWPNRLFAHAATSAGQIDNNLHEEAYDIDTIYDRLDQKGEPWKIYFHDLPQSIALTHLQADLIRDRFRLFDEFIEDAGKGRLPAYSFIEPRYTDFLWLKANDQHPPHDVGLGEYLIADVYEAVRNGPQWDQTALIILWDEHGGIFDRFPPPKAVNPDDKDSVPVIPDRDTRQLKPFKFNLLGVRVPAVIVSPYIPKGTIDSNTYDHTSILATVEKRFSMRPLTKRDAQAATFENLFSLEQPRLNAPPKLDRPQDAQTLKDYNRAHSKIAEVALRVVKQAIKLRDFATTPVSEFQLSLVKLAKSLGARGGSDPAAALRLAQWVDSEHDAAVHLRDFARNFFKNIP